MKNLNILKLLIILLINIICPHFFLGAPNIDQPGNFIREPVPWFTENKGQVSDQNHRPRPDVLFSGTSEGVNFHLRKNGISYQFRKIEKWRVENISPYPGNPGITQKVPELTTIYRLDVNWIGIQNNFSIETDLATEGFNNYYLDVCPNGATHVKTYTGLSYKKIYNGIDLHYYQKDGKLKYDYIVAPGASYKQIRMKIDGAEKIKLAENGCLVLSTPFGDIVEGEPIVFQNKNRVPAKWVVQKNVVSFDIQNYDPSLPLVIDPVVRVWGTYFGEASSEFGWASCTDSNGNIYMSGGCQASGTAIATAGSHQTTYGGWLNDAFLVKFNTNGVRQWGTYYGGTGNDYGNSCALDLNGNVYLAGRTDSNNGTSIATPGSHQPANAGGYTDAFLAQFDCNSGTRHWGTYYGGSGLDEGRCCTDINGNVYLFGRTDAVAGIATPGSHQSSYSGGASDAYLVKFSSLGVRQWSTYYGGIDDDFGLSCAGDSAGNIVMVGATSSQFGGMIATPGSHQANYGGGTSDGFIVKFDSGGQRQWGTYYGGSQEDFLNACAIDNNGNIFVAGNGQSGDVNSIASPGSFQSTYGGGSGPVQDAYLLKFNSNGVRQWGTYYGTAQDEKAYAVAVDKYGNVYMSGQTTSQSVISTTNSPQPLYGGQNDAFVVKFSSGGGRYWGTYYGGYNLDVGYSCNVDANDNIYMVGITQSSSIAGSVIATPGSHQDIYGGAWDAFMVKFNDCRQPVNITPASNLNICSTNTTTLLVNSPVPVSWFNTQTSTITLATGTLLNVPGQSPGTYTYYAKANSCADIVPRVPVSLTVNPSPTISVAGQTLICKGEQNIVLVASGANTYSWSSGISTASYVVSPTVNSTYTVTGTTGICTDSKTISINISACNDVNEITAEDEILVFPNPSTGRFNLSIPVSISDRKYIQWSIVNSLGQIIASANLEYPTSQNQVPVSETLTEKIDISTLPAGIYYLQIERNGFKKIYKLLKE